MRLLFSLFFASVGLFSIIYASAITTTRTTTAGEFSCSGCFILTSNVPISLIVQPSAILTGSAIFDNCVAVPANDSLPTFGSASYTLTLSDVTCLTLAIFSATVNSTWNNGAQFEADLDFEAVGSPEITTLTGTGEVSDGPPGVVTFID